MFTRGGRGSGQIEVFKKMPQALPFSLPAVFRSFTVSLLPCFFRFSFAFSLIYTDQVPGTAYCKPESKIQNPTLQFDLD